MKTRTHQSPDVTTRRQALLGTALLPACGGSFTSGTITGLGSVIVNGIRYAYDDTVSVTIDGAPSDATALQLGMVVRIQGSAITAPATTGALATAKATSIAYGSEWKGPAANVNVGNGTFTLQASRIEVESDAPDRYRLSGVVSGWTETTFLLGSALIQHTTADKPINLANGQLVRVELQTTPPPWRRLAGHRSGG